jgi:hypothetical protein
VAKTAPSPPSLSALARRRLHSLEPEDLRTPEERERDNEEMLQKLRRVRPDLFAKVAELVTSSAEDWFEVLRTRLEKETFLDVLEANLTVEAP